MLATIYEFWLYADHDDLSELYPVTIRLLLYFNPFPQGESIH